MYESAKRVMDVVVAFVLLLLNLPVMAIVAVLILLLDGRPVLFSQDRPGLRGSEFKMVKFRTMRGDDGADVVRLTKLGRVLRNLSLDELPQLLNVLRGQMSLVGPRPLLSDYLPLYSERQARRHEVRPGMTGLAQVKGRNELPWDERLELDVQYVETRSFRGDLSILFATFVNLFRRDGISADGHATMPRFEGSRIIDLARQTGEVLRGVPRQNGATGNGSSALSVPMTVESDADAHVVESLTSSTGNTHRIGS